MLDSLILKTLNDIEQKINMLREAQHQTTDVKKKLALSRQMKSLKMLKQQLFSVNR